MLTAKNYAKLTTVLGMCMAAYVGLYVILTSGQYETTRDWLRDSNTFRWITRDYRNTSLNLTNMYTTTIGVNSKIWDAMDQIMTSNMLSHIPTSNDTHMCPVESPYLVGVINLNKNFTAIPDFEDELSFVLPGGVGRPANCTSQHNAVAIIVPLRDREEHLAVFLRHLHPVLQRQQLDYRIFVVEQSPENRFNKGLIFNAGFLEIEKRFPRYFRCLVLHDVDILPQNDKLLYTCNNNPIQLAAYIDRYKYKYYSWVTGGVSAILSEQYKQVNGHSNLYFGWGGEDDDFRCRTKAKNLLWTHYPPWAKWGNLGHEHGDDNPKRFALIDQCKARQNMDGLNSANYTLIGYTETQFYTNVSVGISAVIYNGTTYQ